MDSAALHHPSRQSAASARLETEFFFDALRCEHERVLAAVRRAGSHLDPSPGTLAEYSAAHARLLQRFLDAQRGLLRRRAESDRVVNVVRTESEEAARSALAAAHAEAVARMMRRALVAAHSGNDAHPLLAEWDRLDAADEAFGPMSGYLDVGGFNRIIDEELPRQVVEADEMFTQLNQLLEQWWQSEQRQAGEQVDLAARRAALLDRLVTIEANEIVEAAGPVPADLDHEPTGDLPQTVALPVDLLAVFEQTDVDALEDLLAGCVALLDDTAPVAVADVVVDEDVRESDDGSAQPVLRFSDFGSHAGPASPTAAPTGGTTVVVRDTPPLPLPVDNHDDDATESLGRQAATIAVRVVAPMAAFSLVFAVLAWLVG